MSDFAMDDASDFSLEALTGAPAPEQGTPEQSAEQAPEQTDTAQPERPRNEKGQFVSEAPPEEERVYAGKYKSVDDLERGHAELQQLYGRMAQDLGQLRDVVQSQQWQPQQPRYDYQQIIEDDPGRAAQAAFQNGDVAAFQAAVSALEIEDPTAAEVWKLRVENLAMQQRVQAQIANVSGYQAQQELDQALLGLASKYPDVAQLETQIGQVLREREALSMMAQSQNPQYVVRALEDAYHIAKARSSDTLGAAAQQVAAAQARANEEALQNAFVASGTAASREESRSLADELTAGWDKIPDRLGWGK